MKLSISSKNEFNFYPDIADNLERPDKDRFAIVVKKVNKWLQASNWTSYEDGDLTNPKIDMSAFYKQHVVRLVNAPILTIDEKIEREMTIEDLFSCIFPELDDLLGQFITFVTKLAQGGIETKKS